MLRFQVPAVMGGLPGSANVAIYPPPIPRSSSAGAIPITNGSVDPMLASPGVYILQTNIPNLTISGSNIKLFCNGFTVRTMAAIGNTAYTSSGIEVYDLIIQSPVQTGGISSLFVYGNQLATKSAVPAVLMDGGGVTSDNFFSNGSVIGSNITLQNMRFERAADGGNLIDDNLIAWAPCVGYSFVPGTARVSSYVTFYNVYWGNDYDQGCEGVGSWDHFDFINCTTRTGIGGWYGPDWPSVSSTTGFLLTNCNFINTTLLQNRSFVFTGLPNESSLMAASDDATANSIWGVANNFFQGTVSTA